MNARKHTNGVPAPIWQRQILELGEQMLRLTHESLARESFPTSIQASQSKLILETVSNLVDGQASLWLAEDDTSHKETAGGPSAGRSAGGSTGTLTALMRRALETRQVCCEKSSGLVECKEPFGDLQSSDARAIAIPVLVQESTGRYPHTLGVLQIERDDRTPFKDDEVYMLDSLALQAGIGLQASRQMVAAHWRVEQLALVRQVSAQIADMRDLDELTRRVTKLIRETFDYYYVAIFTTEPGEDALLFRARAIPPETQTRVNEGESFRPDFDVKVGDGIIGHVAQTGQEILACDVEQETRFLYLEVLPETRSEVALPLKLEDRVLGVLDVQSDQLDDFDDTDLLVLRALAGNIAYAVEGARLYTETHQRASQLSVIQKISKAITSILDQEKLLNEVARLIHKQFGFPFVHLFTVHPGRRKIFYKAGSGPRSQALQEARFAYDLDDPQGIIPWVARHGEIVLANDVSRDPRYRPSPLPPEEIHSELAVPLTFGGVVLGILDLQSERLNAFDEGDRFLFESLADNIAVSLRNATLYRTEVWRRQVADSLREVAGLLSADVSLERVLNAILSELERTLPLDLAAIWLLDEDFKPEEDFDEPLLHLAAVRGKGVTGLDMEIGFCPDDVLAFNPSAVPGALPENASLWLHQALLADQAITRSPGDVYDPIGAALDFSPDYSAIATPLQVGEKRLGLLTLAHRTPGRYGGEARAMTAAFASYAAVAMENTRLYESAHEQAWISTVLLQVAEATQSLMDLDELLDTIIQITPMLAGVQACLLYLFDDEDNFLPAAASGLDPKQEFEFKRQLLAPGDVPAIDHLREFGQPVVVQIERDQQLIDSLFTTEDGSYSLGNELLALIPLLARGEIMGAFLVVYTLELSGGAGIGLLETSFDEKLTIIQGIAHQTAIAIENARLVKSQQEEAYISVALLQVAQAVVSSNDLDEALGSIVRITPILVGVKRSAVYLWDEESANFYLSQSYGLPRRASERRFAPGDFPLLDAVYKLDRLGALPLDADDTGPEQIPDDWSIIPAAEPDKVDQYIENEARLLLAFPLSVKGKVLGTLLVEEPDPNLSQDWKSRGNRRQRAKRLEIITGISRQAALAIQNDLLQREMVVSERLEREIQLARDIQRSFLPYRLPDLPGWDLVALWRTAREVGGDFYDVIDLPGNRLGMVIADVADKGMPAALFMTLTRTLLRAAVQQIDSPSSVLEWVNDNLALDAQDGMFVTLVYAVLSIETGELCYANAGHNPPLVLRHQTHQLEHLKRSGMALGVQEGQSYREQTLTLKPGDILVMYTDGVTEAFSPQDDIYGEERLVKTITIDNMKSTIRADSGTFTAQDILDAIDGSVTAFMGDSMLSDDLTLMVLLRQL